MIMTARKLPCAEKKVSDDCSVLLVLVSNIPSNPVISEIWWHPLLMTGFVKNIAIKMLIFKFLYNSLHGTVEIKGSRV